MSEPTKQPNCTSCDAPVTGAGNYGDAERPLCASCWHAAADDEREWQALQAGGDGPADGGAPTKREAQRLRYEPPAIILEVPLTVRAGTPPAKHGDFDVDAESLFGASP